MGKQPLIRLSSAEILSGLHAALLAEQQAVVDYGAHARASQAPTLRKPWKPYRRWSRNTPGALRRASWPWAAHRRSTRRSHSWLARASWNGWSTTCAVNSGPSSNMPAWYPASWTMRNRGADGRAAGRRDTARPLAQSHAGGSVAWMRHRRFGAAGPVEHYTHGL
jgi:hypothetical protein